MSSQGGRRVGTLVTCVLVCLVLSTMPHICELRYEYLYRLRCFFRIAAGAISNGGPRVAMLHCCC